MEASVVCWTALQGVMQIEGQIYRCAGTVLDPKVYTEDEPYVS